MSEDERRSEQFRTVESSSAGSTFLWGVATSSYQSEGGMNGRDEPRNNWARAEDEKDVAPTGEAAGFWTRYEEDFARCRGLGLNGFRLGLEWARIERTQGHFDEAALDHYVDILSKCRAQGLEPVVTLHHFTHPEWLGVDAWLEKDTPAAFERFVRHTVRYVNERLASPVCYWLTINEPNMLALNTYIGRQFPGKALPSFNNVVRCYNGLLSAHVLAYNAIHDVYEAAGWPRPQVTLNNFCNDLYWSDKVLLDLLALRECEVPREKAGEYVRFKADQFELAIDAANIPLRKDLAYWLGVLFKWGGKKAWRYRFEPEDLAPYLDVLFRSRRSCLMDFIAMDYYDPFTAHVFRFPVLWDHEFKNKSMRSWVINVVTSKWWDWRVLPRGLRFFCDHYSRQYGGRKVLIAENGMALRRRPDNMATPRRDRLTRSEFLRLHVHEVVEAVKAGIPVMGYLHWSLFDNYEWGTFTPRFGLFSLDYTRGSERLVQDHLGDRPSETYAALVQEAREAIAAVGL